MQSTQVQSKKLLTGYPSIDRPWEKYYQQESLSKPLPKSTVYGYIHSENQPCLSDTAFLYFGRKISYGTIFNEIDKATAAFIACGVKQGDCVSLLTSSSPESCYAILALNRIGAIANLLNPLFTPEQIIERIVDTKTKVLLALDQLYVPFRKFFANLGIEKTIIFPITESMPGLVKLIAGKKLKTDIAYNENVLIWSDFLKLGRKEDYGYEIPYEPQQPALMVYSSGTTGQPKGIVLGNDGLVATMSHYKTPDFVYTRGDSFLQIIPIWFSTGMVLSFLMPLSLGITVILEPSYGDENFVKDVLKYKPNIILVPTSLWLALLNSPKAGKVDLHGLNYAFQGGEKVIERTEDAVNEFLQAHGCPCKLQKGYGMCELGSTVSTENPSHKKYISTGYPILNVVISAFDPKTNQELHYGERGELRVMSASAMMYYYNRPDATEAFFHVDDKGQRWACTGDYGYVDEDGFVFLLGRHNDTFTTPDGKIVYNFDVEDAILKNDNVFQCEVIGVPDDKGGETLAGFIVLEPKCTEEPDKVLRDVYKTCCETLSPEAVPEKFRIVEKFVTNRSGKRDVEILREIREGYVTFGG